MFEFDIKEIEKKLEEEYPTSMIIKKKAQSILNYHPALHDVIEHWLKGEYLNFEYEGISLRKIVEENDIPFSLALSDMDTLLKNPNLIEGYKKLGKERYTVDFVGERKRIAKRRSYKWL